jgi:hypothetical protein
MNIPYQTQSEIEAVMKGFESCKTDKGAFTHRSHLTVAVSYLHNSTLEQATNKMRLGLHRFLEHHGVGPGKYHETLTVFWIKIVHEVLVQSDPNLSLLQTTNAVIERLSDSSLVYDYYSKELLLSDEARKGWIEPDRKTF